VAVCRFSIFFIVSLTFGLVNILSLGKMELLVD
jgi:hypothetical protein